MSNDYFHFKQFTIRQDRCVFRVGTDGVILGAAADVSDAETILDIGAGTGLISLMLAQRSEAEVVALEPDKESFGQMEENIRASKWTGRIEAVNLRLQDYSPGITFDLIVSNPPYFTGSLKNPDARKATTRHADTLPRGELLAGAERLMSDKGRFCTILPYAEGNVLIAMAAGYGLYCIDILKIRPMPTSEIMRLVLSFSRKKTKTTERFLTIEHGRRHDFTREYVELTKEFYLKF
jgi:tRNA1Val (adenine37-N6)-methyltransferase